MPPKVPTKVAQARAAAAARKELAARAEGSSASTSTLPPAASLPTEPMELDGIDETGEGDTEMADSVEGSGHVVDGERLFMDQVDGGGKGKGKGKALEDDMEMKSLQNVKDLGVLGPGMEGMADPVWKGKALTDSIKNVSVRFFSLVRIGALQRT